jgi:acetyltransferase
VSVRDLDALFAPQSVAVIGASDRPRSVGAVVIRNLLRGGFRGPVMPVNPEHDAVGGVLAYPDVASLPVVPDLAVLCTPPETVPGLAAELVARGVRAAIVLTAGLSGPGAPGGHAALLRAARRRMRILGPNCIGLLVPGIGLNASFAHVDAPAGGIAFVSQSGALCTAVLDWARGRGIGFSHFISLGDSVDVDVGDALDYLGADPSTRSILLYVEAVAEARKFMSAARAAGRNKPVIAIKSGRESAGARAAASHTGALAGADDVYDAAFRRAGMLRVREIEELFGAAETLARARDVRGDRLLILSNGGGPGVMATDALVAGGGTLAPLSDALRQELDALLPATWSRANPVDLVGDASAERYGQALRLAFADGGADAILVLNAPTAIASSEEAAEAIAASASARPAALFTSWMGGDGAEGARDILRRAGVATYETPERAVRAFLHAIAYRRNQEQLMETPPSLPAEFSTRPAEARSAIERARRGGQEWLTEPEAKAVLSAYGLPSVETCVTATAEEAAERAGALGFPVALKLVSAKVVHNSEVGGVALDLETPEAVREAGRAIERRLAEMRPDATFEGLAVQPMVRRPGAFELIAGATTDPVFGPVLVFGHGGTDVELLGDRAVGLPPLNLQLARALIDRTRIARRLAGHRGRAPADRDAIALALVRLSQLLIDLPEVRDVDVNPLLADAQGVLALDARIRIGPEAPAPGFAIRPYPSELRETLQIADGRRVVVRPIRPEDEPAHRLFFERLDSDDVYFRFFSLVREMPHSQLARYTQIDYDREMAFIAHEPDAADTLGVVRAVSDPDNTEAEFAIIVRSDLKGKGLGRALLEKMIRYCRERGTGELVGQVLSANHAMLSLAGELGFERRFDAEAGVVEVRLRLGPRPRTRR